MFEEEERFATSQLLQFVKALVIHIERSNSRGNAWNRLGARGAAFYCKDKADRIWELAKAGRPFGAEIPDLINYAAFAKRMEESDNYGGEFWPES